MTDRPLIDDGEPCIHGLTPSTCTICLHGVDPLPNPAFKPCRYCDELILWVVTDKNHVRMPLDPEPCEDGNVIKVRRDPNGDKIVHTLHRDETTDKPRYKSHWATCTNPPARKT